MADRRTFKIGLTMAGAVSAGAYTAGVLDFLFTALDEWERAKRRERKAHGPDTRRWSVPGHDVEIVAVSGASAGGICGAILAASLGRQLPPVPTPSPPEPTGNVLYDTWVLRARIAELLTTDDLDGGPRTGLPSLLNSHVLDRIARDALTFRGNGWRRPPWIADPMQLFLATGNLRGIPYRIAFRAEDETIAGHDMVLHGDHQHFYLATRRDAALEAVGAARLDPRDPEAPGWAALRAAALATSAFPVGLAARPLERAVIAYRRRPFLVPEAVTGSADHFEFLARTIEPTCLGQDGETYRFISVDGGTYDNEPFELVDRVLREGRPFIAQRGDEADRALLMVDPFPDPFDCQAPYVGDADVVTVVRNLLGSFIHQCRFKLEDLILAQAESVFSRFLIAPIRRRALGARAERFPIAGGSLGTFGGFLSEAFRRHDFELGRLNCQRFLKTCFLLYASNPLFLPWSEDLASPRIEPYLVQDADPEAPPPAQRAFLPIIPLVGAAAHDLPPPTWPSLPGSDLDELEAHLGARADAIVVRLRESYAPDLLAGALVRAAWWAKRADAVGAIRSFIEADLEMRGLLG